MSSTKGSFIVAGITTLCVDIATKVTAVAMLSGGAVDLGSMELRLVYNEGVAFGLGDSVPSTLLLVVVAAVTVVFVAAVSRGALPANAVTGLVAGGAIANLADRAIGGSVVDMFDLGWWPTFNVADMCIMFGAGVLVLQSLRNPAQGALPESA